MIHVLFGTPPEFQSLVFNLDDEYVGPGVVEDVVVPADAERPSNASKITQELSSTRLNKGQSSARVSFSSKISRARGSHDQSSWRLPELPQEEPDESDRNNALIPLAELNQTHFLMNAGCVAINFREHLQRKIFEPTNAISIDERWELLVPKMRRWILQACPEMDECLWQEIEQALSKGYPQCRRSEIPEGTVMQTLRTLLGSIASRWSGYAPDKISGEDLASASLSKPQTSVMVQQVRSDSFASDDASSTGSEGAEDFTIGSRLGQMEVIFAQFGKFVFDSETAAEKAEAKVVDLDLCDQKGSISGVTLIPDFERQITDYEIFAARELHYPILLSKMDAYQVAFPESARIQSSSSVALSTSGGSNLPVVGGVSATAALTTSRNPPKKLAGGKKAPAGGRPNPGKNVETPQSQQRQQQSPRNSLLNPSITSSTRSNAKTEAECGEKMDIADFVHPLLLMLFRPDSEAGREAAKTLAEMQATADEAAEIEAEAAVEALSEAAEEAATEAAAEAELAEGSALGMNLSAAPSPLRRGLSPTTSQPRSRSGSGQKTSKTLPPNGSNKSRSPSKSPKPSVLKPSIRNTNASTKGGPPSTSMLTVDALMAASRSKSGTTGSRIDEEEEAPPPPPPPPPTGVKMLREKVEEKLTEEKMLRMASLLESREIEEEDKEVLRDTRLTSGVRVLLYLRDQFTESSLKEFLDCLKLSLIEFRMFEEEQMILKMPIFQEEVRESVDYVEELD